MSIATTKLPTAKTNTQSLDIPRLWGNVGIASAWDDASAHFHAALPKRVFFHNSNRPAAGGG